MNGAMKKPWVLILLAGALVLAVLAGGRLADGPEMAGSDETLELVVKPSPTTMVSASLPQPPPSSADTPTAASLLDEWSRAVSFEEMDRIAATLAEMSTAESVQALMDGIRRTAEWSERAALAKNLRAVSDPETLVVLVPALLHNYGRGSTILGEIVDAIARLAQPETIDDLAALHWQASTQAGQGHKVLRAVAAIRNPAAKRGLERLVARSDSPALSAAAQEAIKVMQGKEAGQATEQ